MENLDTKVTHFSDTVEYALLKFILTLDRFETVIRPIGAWRQSRRPEQAIAAENQLSAIRKGFPHLALLGRVRDGRVDTGTLVIDKAKEVSISPLWDKMLLHGFKLADMHYFVRDRDSSQATYVLVLGMMVNPKVELQLSVQQSAILRRLISSTWGYCAVWINPPPNPATVNCNFLRRGDARADRYIDYVDGRIELV